MQVLANLCIAACQACFLKYFHKRLKIVAEVQEFDEPGRAWVMTFQRSAFESSNSAWRISVFNLFLSKDIVKAE